MAGGSGFPLGEQGDSMYCERLLFQGTCIIDLGAAIGMGGGLGRVEKPVAPPSSEREDGKVQGRQRGCRLHPHPCGAFPRAAQAALPALWHPRGENSLLLWLRLSSLRGASVSLRLPYSLALLR